MALDHRPPLAHASELGVDWLFLETCFLARPPGRGLAGDAADAGIRVGFSWGHGWPEGRLHGLHGGRMPEAEAELRTWIRVAADHGHPLLRITAGSPPTRGEESAAELVGRLVGPLRRAVAIASDDGVTLCLENHGDLRASDLVEVLERVDHPNLGVCLDNVNLTRVGDDMYAGTRQLLPFVRMVQLKDCLPGDPAQAGGPVSTGLGEGSVDLLSLVDLLCGAPSPMPVCVELASLPAGPVDELAMVERSVAWLRERLPDVGVT